MLKLIQKKVLRSVTIDTHEEYENGTRIRTLPELIEFIKKNYNREFKVLYSSPSIIDNPFDPGSEFNRLCFFLYHVPDFILILDEVNFYTTANSIPEQLKILITQGRRQFIDIVGAVRRKVETNNILTSQANIVVSFKQRLPEDIDYLRDYIGKEAELIPALEPLEFVYGTDYETGRDKVNHNGEPVKFIEKVLDMNGGF